MKKIFSYVLRYDAGATPNPFWGTCTLTICKSDIRLAACKGDWVIGTGSKKSHLKDGNVYDLTDSLVYAMKVSKKLTLADYDIFCQRMLLKKTPQRKNGYPLCVGDCIYDYSKGEPPTQRKGVHDGSNMKTDIKGRFALLSKCFYYFGEKPQTIPQNLIHIIKKGSKHKIMSDSYTIRIFEKWIGQFKKGIHADPQLKFEFGSMLTSKQIIKCAARDLKDS